MTAITCICPVRSDGDSLDYQKDCPEHGKPVLYQPKATGLEARQVLPPPLGNGIDLARWCHGEFLCPREGAECAVVVPVHSGEKRAEPGDWIVKGTHAFMVYSEEAFRLTYEPVPDEDALWNTVQVREQVAAALAEADADCSRCQACTPHGTDKVMDVIRDLIGVIACAQFESTARSRQTEIRLRAKLDEARAEVTHLRGQLDEAPKADAR